MLSSAWRFWRYSNTSFSYLFIEKGMSEAVVNSVVNGMILLLIISTVLIWIEKKWAAYLSLSASLVLFLEASAQSFYPTEPTAIYNLPCHAVRYCLPLALLMLCLKKEKHAWNLMAVATGLTFFGHGMKALLNDFMFQDYILAFFADMGKPIELATSLTLLHIIGTIDIALAHHICFFKWRRLKWILRYMTLWGAISAFARITYSGWAAWHDVTLRAPHFLVPLALLLYCSTFEKNLFKKVFKSPRQGDDL